MKQNIIVSDGGPANQASPKLDTQDGSATFISQKELLRRISVSRRTLVYWVQRGTIPAIKVGRRILFHPKSVEEALLRRQRPVVF